ncbi:MAG: tetratricopeptide repeat protein [Nitrospirota bacterium]|nr:tetratricopeptide repeat protein [Nitrospirota bacterium]
MATDTSFTRRLSRLISKTFGCVLVGLLLFKGIQGVWAEPGSLSTEPSKSPLTQLQTLQSQGSQDSSDPATLLQLADLYLQIGQDIYQDENQKRQAFDEGARLARRVLDMEEHNAEAHYLYAANLGSSAQTAGVMASAFTVNTLKTHVKRALELSPDHAPALHMMGMMLEELPWFLGGDKDMAITYLVRALEAKPDYTGARLDLAKIYIKRQNQTAAGAELLKIINTDPPSPSSESRQQDQREANKLLNSLIIQP